MLSDSSSPKDIGDFRPVMDTIRDAPLHIGHDERDISCRERTGLDDRVVIVTL